MVTKIAAMVFAVAVAAVGSYVYMSSSCDHGPCPNASQSVGTSPDCCSLEQPSCCQQPSRSNLIDAPCCSDDKEVATPEVLAIQPREVK